MTLMTMNCKGSLNGVRHSAVESRDRAMGREQWERKCLRKKRIKHNKGSLAFSLLRAVD
jgi:hypothetical protein